MLLDMQGAQDMTGTTSSTFHIQQDTYLFITRLFTMLMLCLGRPNVIGATLAVHNICNDI